MIKFMPIRYWKNISLALFITGLTFTLVGTFCIKGNLVVHWSDEGVPNNFAGKWVLWAMLLLAFLSMFTGMTTGITRDLIPSSQVIIILMMYLGRIGTMSFAYSFFEKRNVPAIQNPVEKVMVG